MCEAYNVDYITFSCGMENIEVKATRERAEEFVQLDGSIVMQNVVEAFITLRRDRIEKYDDGQDYWCQCYAHYSVPGMEDKQILSSQKGYVEIAFIRKNFQKSPQNQFVKQGEFLSIECRPPIGNPQPKVSWLKNGEPVEALNVLPNGALIFESAQPEDGGNYQCVAQNEAGRRSSERILVEVEAMEGAVVVGGGGVDTEEGLGGEEVEGEIVEGTIVDGDEVIVTGEPEGEAEDKQEGEGVVIVGESEPTGEPDSDKTGEEFVVAEGEPTGEPDSDETGGEVVVEEGEPEGETSEDQTGEAVVVGEGGDPEGEAEDKQEGEDVVVVGEVEPTGEPDDGQKGEGVVVVAEGEPTGETQDGGEGYAEETTEEEGEAEENQEGVIVVAGGIPEGEDVEPEEGKGEDQMGAGEAEGVMDGEKEEGTQGERKSETVDEEEYVTQVVPEIEVPSTPEDDSVSEVEVGATPEEDSTPANEVVISFEDDSDPEKEIVISVEDNSTPEGEVDISDEDNSDPESEVVIAEEDHSDPESEVVIAEEDHSDPESEVVIAEEDHSDPESEVVIAEEDHSDPESEVVIAEEDHSDPESEVVIAEEDNNDPKNEVGISVKEDSTPESEVGISVEDNTTFQSEVGISVEDNTDPENEVGISAKDNSAPESEAGASVEDDSAPENEVGTTTEEGTQSEKGEEEEEDDIGFETVVVYEGDYRDTLEKEPVEEVPKGEVDMDQIGGATGDKTCMAMLNTCQKVLPPNTDATVVCKKFDEYKECTDRFMKACTGILSEESMNAVKMARMNVEQNCMAITSQCPKLEQCKLIYSNVLDDSAGSSGLPVQSFCMDIDSFLRCVDQTLLDCNVSMTSPGDMKPSLSSIGTWFEEYCDGLIMGSNSIASCDQIVSCDLKFTQVAGDNSTYWCRMMDSLLQCTENAVDTCGLDELRDDLTYLHDQAKQFSCGEHMGTGTDYNPEEPAVGEPEVDTEPEANGSKDGGNDYGGQPDAETDGADPEGDDKEMEEGETGSVSDPDKENGATSMSKSAILAIFMQLILATLLSWR
ncbi:uncharacterized protein LOC101852646 [Aplysia californica]|uniref:Uncharacterized protein LOC101852646 n=1 Tax=Aplysia californica TaxID=6500 RepID=A0ABM0K0F6_APLCA|nr:uncharacterized protein LOC101852646 [Aplysia californica]